MTFKPFSLELPWPPSMNSYWRAVPRGKIAVNILSAPGRVYREKAVSAAKDAERPEGTLTDRLGVCLILRPPDKRRRDVDNFVKPVLDALTHAQVYEDDYQIDRLMVVRSQKVPKGSVTVKLYPANLLVGLDASLFQEDTD